MSFVTEKIVRALRTHICEGCDQDIEPGTNYLRFTGVDDRIYKLAYHPECRAVECELNRVNGLWGDDWMPLWMHVDEAPESLLEDIDPIVAARFRERARKSEAAHAARLEAHLKTEED